MGDCLEVSASLDLTKWGPQRFVILRNMSNAGTTSVMVKESGVKYKKP